MKPAGAAALIAFFIVVLWCISQRSNNRPRIIYTRKMPANYNALTVPPFGIFISQDEKENRALLDHELRHWKQYQREGLIPFTFGYARAARRFGYDGNPYEIEARSNESEFCRTNYTECVRTGRSQTVNNPNFRA